MRFGLGVYLIGLTAVFSQVVSLMAGEADRKPSAVVEAAVAHEGRTDADRERDENSHPAKMLEFMGVRPGQHVADLFCGEGYFSELLSHVVGPNGKVYAHNNKAYRDFLKEKAHARYAGNRLANVVLLDTEPDDLGLPEGELDLVLMVMSYHDLYWKNPGWPVFDHAAFFAQLRKALKPGGKLVILDHAAAPGTGAESVQDLHRIDEAFAKAQIEKEGFSLEAESKVLRNPADDKTVLVFDPKVRGKTDKFAFLFKKTR